MTVEYSLDLSQTLRPNKSKTCQACGLYQNQPPIFERAKNPQIFWVGLSAVRLSEEIDSIPLAPQTKSGALIAEIEQPLRDELSFYKTNLVKCLPLNNEKIRYPIRKEMEKCYINFKYEVKTFKPTIVFLLGKQVASFVFKKITDKQVELCKHYNYETVVDQKITFIPVHHPSYILIYNRKSLDKYISSIRNLCKASLRA